MPKEMQKPSGPWSKKRQKQLQRKQAGSKSFDARRRNKESHDSAIEDEWEVVIDASAGESQDVQKYFHYTTPVTAPTASYLYFGQQGPHVLFKQQQEIVEECNNNVAEPVKPPTLNEDFQGRRIVSCESLDDCMNKVSLHSGTHEGVHFSRSKEIKYGGLHRDICYSCTCGYEVVFSSDYGKTSLPVNKALSEAALVTPVGYESVLTFLTTLDLPTPSNTFFLKLQDESRTKIDSFVEKNLLAAGREERRLAEEAGDFIMINGIRYVWITVILDGGWPKRSYSHSYDSPCGVAVIIGARTGKILFYGTRTKTCVICNTATNKGDRPKDHRCFKNWDKSSTAMEQDIILEGFMKSVEMHNVVYRRFVGDGDSSVHAAVIDVYHGIKVQKIECSNHVTKNLNKKLHEISSNAVRGKNAPNIPKEERQLNGMAECFGRLGRGVHMAIVHHSQYAEVEGQVKQLYDDIVNVPLHVFGDHTNCREYFCNCDDKIAEENRVPIMSKMVFWGPMMKAILHVANLAPGLIFKCNTNRAECFMSIANKYVEGKRKHFGGSFLYSLRMSCAVLSFNLSPFWLFDLNDHEDNATPLTSWQWLRNRGIKQRQRVPKKRAKKGVRFGFLKNRKGDQYYGSEPTTPEFTAEQLQLGTDDLFRKLQVNEVQRQSIEQKTRDQSDSTEWFEERSSRITASVAGKLFKLRPTSDNSSTLNCLLKSNGGRGSAAMEYGKESEGLAISAYEHYRGYSPGYVQKVGLLVSRENGIFGASPDGLVGELGLVEIKCPYSIRDSKPVNWPKHSKDSPLYFSEDGILLIKKTHNHFYQIMMQLYVCEREWVDYVVWTPHGIHVQRICKDSETNLLWENMKIKLEEFWRGDLAPEIVDSMKKRGKEYRCSDKRLVGRKRLLELKQKRTKKKSV